jgi:pimeloyl-ACP methyl ester carboxylesterase
MAGMSSTSGPVPTRPDAGVPRLHHVEHGDGIPVLVLHGAYSALEEPEGYLEPYFRTRPGHRRIYVDLPGMGDSPADGIAGPDDALAAVESVVDDLVADAPFLLIAQSFGCYLARGLADRRPAQVAGLAMICPLLVSGEFAGEHAPVLVDGDLQGVLTVEQDAEYRGYFVVQTPETAQRFLDAVAPVLGRFDAAAVERIMGERLDPDPDDGPAFTAPTLIAVGRQDALVGYADQWGTCATSTRTRPSPRSTRPAMPCPTSVRPCSRRCSTTGSPVSPRHGLPDPAGAQSAASPATSGRPPAASSTNRWRRPARKVGSHQRAA